MVTMIRQATKARTDFGFPFATCDACSAYASSLCCSRASFTHFGLIRRCFPRFQRYAHGALRRAIFTLGLLSHSNLHGFYQTLAHQLYSCVKLNTFESQTPRVALFLIVTNVLKDEKAPLIFEKQRSRQLGYLALSLWRYKVVPSIVELTSNTAYERR